MSNRYYDNKGVEHFTKENAEWANRRYVQEEEEAGKQGLELQRKQVEVAERAEKEAYWQRREQEKAQQEQLSELKRQGQTAQRDRDYQKNVLFLKESDEATRLDTFVGMLVNSLDWKCCPEDEDGNYDGWCDENGRLVALFYKPPELPKECRADGSITKEILTLVNTPPASDEAFLPKDALPLKAESDKFDEELRRRDQEISKLGMSGNSGCVSVCLGILGVVLLVISVHDYVLGTGNTAVCYVFGIGLAMSAIAVALPLVRRLQSKTRQKRLETLEGEKTEIAQKKDVLQRRLQPFRDEARLQAGKQITARTIAEQWIAVYRTALVKNFFKQGLWIEDQFPNRLKAVLQEIQRPFPTSCRADVNNLSKDQIQSAYLALAATVADLMNSKLTRSGYWDSDYPFVQSLLSASNAGTDDEKTALTAIFLKAGVLLDSEKSGVENNQREKTICEILMAGPEALKMSDSQVESEPPPASL